MDTDLAPGSGSIQSTAALDPLPCPAENRTPANKTSEAVCQEVIQAVLNEGLSFKAASERFSLDRDTVSGIVRQHLSETGELENLRLGAKFHNLADKVLDELNGRDLTSASPSQLGILAGIAIDKKVLLTGKPTAGNGRVSMKVAWRDGSGAVEITAGGGHDNHE